MNDLLQNKKETIEEDLHRREMEYASLVENTTDLIARFDTDLRYTYCNPMFERLGSRSINKYLGKTILKVGARVRDSVEILDRAARQALATGDIQQVEHLLLTKFGFRYYQTRIIPERNENGQIVSLFSVGRDITDHKLLEELEREQRRLAEALQDTAVTLSSSLNIKEILEIVLDHVEKVVPYDAMTISWLDGEQLHVLRSRGFTLYDEQRVLNQVFSVQQSATLRWVIENRRPLVIPDVKLSNLWESYPQTDWVQSHVKAPVIVENKVVGLLNLHNKAPGFYNEKHARILQALASQFAIAAQNAMLYEKVQNLATVDELTGLYNRRGFFEVSRREVVRLKRHGRSISALFIDIDHFKQFNDRYSYEVGDRVLRDVAQALQHYARETDVVGRYGGEEMVILLPEVNQADAIEMGERLRRIVETLPIPSNLGNLGVTISMGIATIVPIEEKTITTGVEAQNRILEDLLAKAGKALHVAKQQGRNRIEVYKDDS